MYVTYTTNILEIFNVEIYKIIITPVCKVYYHSILQIFWKKGMEEKFVIPDAIGNQGKSFRQKPSGI